MDIYAYFQMDQLEEVAQNNDITIPRTRGYRLMKDEEPISQEEINDMLKSAEINVIKDLCISFPFWTNSHCYSYDVNSDKKIKKYLETNLDKDGFEEYTKIKWENIHGKKRKLAKRLIKETKRRIIDQYDMWNKYAGKTDVLYIHSRCGGDNWEDYDEKYEILNASWFLGRVDDSFDNSYCDFYAKIKMDN